MHDANNPLLDKTEEPITYLVMAVMTVYSPLWREKGCTGKNVGDTVEVALSPDDAFGEQDPEWCALKM